jgi:hypothetical protein
MYIGGGLLLLILIILLLVILFWPPLGAPANHRQVDGAGTVQ